MTKSKKMLALVIALVIMLVAVSGTLIAVLVAGNQNAQSKVHVKYTSSDVNVKVEAKYYIGSTGTDMVDKSNSNATSIELDANKTTGSLDQPTNEVSLTKENNKIIYEYKFTNLSTTIPATIGQLVENGSVVVPKDSNNNVKLTYTSSSTSLGPGATSDATTLNTQGLPASSTRYVYVIVSIVELLNDVDFEGTFGWDLKKGEGTVSTTNNTSATSGIIFDTTQTGLYNKSDVEQLQLVVGVENTEPEVYPMVANKCFTGWYTDSALTQKATFPMNVSTATKLYPKHETGTSDLTYTYDSSTQSYMVGANMYGSGYSGSATNIIIPDVYNDGTNGLHSVTSIGGYAFSGCTGLTSITIPNSVTSIGDGAFNGCTGLTSITIPSSVISIGDGAFSGCTGLTSITIPSRVTSIGDLAFYGCSGLTSIAVDSGNSVYRSEGNCLIQRSDNQLILGCKNSIIPSSVTSIGGDAFSGCTVLNSITIPNSVISIGSSAFYDCTGLTSITIPDSVTSIGSSAFYGCSGLTSITIPDSVISIGPSGFSGCSGLTSIAVDSGNSVYRSEGDCIIKRSTNTLILGCKNSIIPSGVTSIGDGAFSGCTGLISITIPNSVTSIGNYAFSGTGLTSITIGSGVKKIGRYAFSGCSKLTSATFKTTTGWTVTTSSTATTGTAVTISTTNLAANATLLKTTHKSKYWNRA